MRELWWKIAGALRVKLTGAQPEQTLSLMAEKVSMEDVTKHSELEVSFAICRRDLPAVEEIAHRHGDDLRVVEEIGLPALGKNLAKQWLLCLTALGLILATWVVPNHIFLFQVEGNDTVPRRRILEQAAVAGLRFGVSRGEIRSEQIKNRLLEQIPELKWVGVNTKGCLAVISVEQRQNPRQETPSPPGNIVAGIDGSVTNVIVTNGTALCAPGDGVRKGQVLISGYTDLGRSTRVEAARGEIYAQTQRENQVMIPAEWWASQANTRVEKKYALIFGKKRIKFHSDSGILYPGCGKMTEIKQLLLPGGWPLPVALVVECYQVCDLQSLPRQEETAQRMLETASRWQIQGQMIAGQIQLSSLRLERRKHGYCLEGTYRCLEMIGRWSSGIRTEGDRER